MTYNGTKIRILADFHQKTTETRRQCNVTFNVYYQ